MPRRSKQARHSRKAANHRWSTKSCQSSANPTDIVDPIAISEDAAKNGEIKPVSQVHLTVSDEGAVGLGEFEDGSEDTSEWKDIFAEDEIYDERDDVAWNFLITSPAEQREGANKFRSSYTGDSKTTAKRKRRRLQEMANSVKGIPTLLAHFSPKNVKVVYHSSISESEEIRNEPATDSNFEDSPAGLGAAADFSAYSGADESMAPRPEPTKNASFAIRIIREIDTYLIAKTRDNSNPISNEERGKLEAIQTYCRHYQTGITKGEARRLAAIGYGKSEYWARCLLAWTEEWDNKKSITLSRRGKHPKVVNILAEEDVYLQLKSWLQESKPRVSTEALMQYVQSDVLPQLNIAKTTISKSTAIRWLHILGWEFSRVKQGYVDGHERPDVVEYRGQFLRQMKDYQRRMIKAKECNVEELESVEDLDLHEGERPIIFYTHDESVFHANDSENIIWHRAGEMPLRKKGQGRPLMVSDFLSEVDGPLALRDEDGKVKHVRKIIHPGKIYDGYWTKEHMAAQFQEAINMHLTKYPEYGAVWAFDNSTNHNCYANDALRVSQMNLGSATKQREIRDGKKPDGTSHVMVTPEGYPKGMKQVLQERGLWEDHYKKICSACKDRNEPNNRTTCCATRVLELQPDFRDQKTLLVEIAESSRQEIIFYPKFHCEFNFIEMYWGLSKNYTRKNCDYTFRSLQTMVPQALDSVKLTTIRRFACKAFRTMDAYRQGLTGELLERAVKKYKSHRTISEAWIREVLAQEGT